MEWNISISRNLFLQGIPFLSVFLQPRKSMEKDSLSFLPYLIPDIWRKIDLLTKERKKMLWKQDFSSVLAQSIPSGRDIANSFPPCVEHRKMINYFAHVSLWCHPAKDIGVWANERVKMRDRYKDDGSLAAAAAVSTTGATAAKAEISSKLGWQQQQQQHREH